MRKFLLTVGIAMIAFSAFAQNEAQLLLPRQQRLHLNDPAPVNGIPSKVITSPVFKKAGSTASATRGNAAGISTKIGSSANIFTALVPEQHCFGYKKIGSHDVYYLIHRQCNSFVSSSDLASTGYIEMDASINHGKNFDSSMHRVFVKTHNGSLRPRYPSGDLFVPSGDTSWLNAIAIGSGPVTNGKTVNGWSANWFGSCSMDTMYKHHRIINNALPEAPDFVFPRLSTTATSNFVWSLAIDESPNDTTNNHFRGLGLYKGTYIAAGDSFSWSVTKLPIAARSYKAYNTTTKIYDTGYYFASANMAWGNDGKTGYIVASAVDSVGAGNDHFKYHIWKTTDEGITWTTSVLDPNDTLYYHLKDSVPTLRANSGVRYFIPSNDEDLVVDANGNLHIVTGYTGAYSASGDSLFYTYSRFGGKTITDYQVDFFQNTKGTWSYFQIGKLATIQASAIDNTNPYASGTPGQYMSWGSRMQASCEYSTNKVFYTWLDSDPTNISNFAPDIFISALDLKTGNYKPAANMTGNGSLPQSYYWLFAAKNILKTTSGSKNIYTVPASCSLPFTSTFDGSLPHDHYFVSGLNISEDSFNVKATIFNSTVSTNEIKNIDNIVRVYPNPANTHCTIEYASANNSPVTVEVTNLLGQTVHTQNITPYTGVNRVNIDMTNMTQGMYLIVVKNGETRTTYKLIKE